MDSTANIIGAYLREKRLAAGLYMWQVAKAAGVAESTVSRLETGKWIPTVDVLLHIADALSIHLNELFAKLGVQTKRTLPELEDFLREKYGVSEETITDVAAHFRKITGVPGND